MRGWASHLHAHPRLYIAAAIGIAAAILVPDALTANPPVSGPTAPFAAAAHPGITRSLIGWIAGVWAYLVLISLMMWRADKGHLQRVAASQAEGAAAVLTLVTLGAIASFGAVVLELASAKAPGVRPALSHLVLVLLTVAGSWLLVPTLFGLNYASLYYAGSPDKGLAFPNSEKAFEPDYADFLYFSFTIAVASQTADVSITTRPMRRLALFQSVLAFVFNATVLAFSINIAAGLF
jgi:uncharacterized membrane protein